MSEISTVRVNNCSAKEVFGVAGVGPSDSLLSRIPKERPKIKNKKYLFHLKKHPQINLVGDLGCGMHRVNGISVYVAKNHGGGQIAFLCTNPLWKAPLCREEFGFEGPVS